MVDDELAAPHDDYDLLTQYEAGKRLTDNINAARRRCDEARGEDLDVQQKRLAALEDAQRRHREYRPADDPTFFNADGHIEEVRTTPEP